MSALSSTLVKFFSDHQRDLKLIDHTDLSSLFHWNTKQIFLYVTTTYPSDSPSTVPPSEAVVWDAVIPASNAPWHQNTYVHPGSKLSAAKSKSKSKKNVGAAYPAGGEPGIIKLTNQRPKYQITDYTGKIAERSNATLQLNWNVQPWVGLLTWTNRNNLGRWQGLRGGLSEPFDFPSLKGAEAKKEELPVATGGEKNRGPSA